MASLPTGMTNSGSSNRSSSSSQTPQAVISSGDGTRSPPVLFLPGKTPAHRRHVNRRPELSLRQAGRRLEPPKQGFPRRPRKRAAQLRFLVSRRLANQDHLAHHRSPLTTGGCMPGHFRQARRASTCRSSRLAKFARARPAWERLFASVRPGTAGWFPVKLMPQQTCSFPGKSR